MSLFIGWTLSVFHPLFNCYSQTCAQHCKSWIICPIYRLLPGYFESHIYNCILLFMSGFLHHIKNNVILQKGDDKIILWLILSTIKDPYTSLKITPFISPPVYLFLQIDCELAAHTDLAKDSLPDTARTNNLPCIQFAFPAIPDLFFQ